MLIIYNYYCYFKVNDCKQKRHQREAGFTAAHAGRQADTLMDSAVQCSAAQGVILLSLNS